MERYAPEPHGAGAARHGLPRRSTRRSARAGASAARTTSTSTSAHLGQARSIESRSCPTSSSSRASTRASSRSREPMPIQPTAHYAMGGIPTDIHGRVVIDEHEHVVPGLYAAGEMRLRQRPRRQPPGHQLPGRPGRLRPPRRDVDGRGRRGAGELPDAAVSTPPSRCAREIDGAARPPATASPGPDPRRDAADDDGRLRRLSRPRRPCSTPSNSARPQGAIRAASASRTRAGLQHGPARGPRAGLPARLRRGDRDRPRWPARRAAAPTPARTSPTATTRTGSSTRWPTGAEGGPKLRYKPVTLRPLRAQAARLLTRAIDMQVELKVLRYDPERDESRAGSARRGGRTRWTACWTC